MDLDYKKSGVDTEKARQYLHDLKGDIQSTFLGAKLGSVVDNFGGFAGVFNPTCVVSDQYLVATTDGVGTKIDLCQKWGSLSGLGQDLVAMCVNDLYCVGAKPAFFLDYISCGKLDKNWYEPFLKGLSQVCKSLGMPLLGGETAEHPGVMGVDEFDLAGFCIGFVDKDKLLPRVDEIIEGDVVVALPSSGFHSNGFSLIRKILASEEDKGTQNILKDIHSFPNWQQAILEPTRIYSEVPQLLETFSFKGIAHITGGGIYENVARILPKGLSVFIENPYVFTSDLMKIFTQNLKRKDAFSTFNMGLGMVFILDQKEYSKLQEQVSGIKFIGKVVVNSSENQKVHICF